MSGHEIKPGPADRPAIASFKPVVDHPSSARFVDAVGKLMQNFAFIELLTLRWIDCLGTDEVLIREVRGQRLSRRIELVRKLTSDDRFPLPSEDQAVILKLWIEVGKLVSLRNDVAHNPAFFTFEDGDQDRPESAGILNLRPRTKGSAFEIIDVEEIHAGIRRSAELAQQLESALVDLELLKRAG